MWKRPHTFSCLSSLKSVYYQWSYSPHYVIPELIFLVAFFLSYLKFARLTTSKYLFLLWLGSGNLHINDVLALGLTTVYTLSNGGLDWLLCWDAWLVLFSSLASALTWFLHLLILLRCPPSRRKYTLWLSKAVWLHVLIIHFNVYDLLPLKILYFSVTSQTRLDKEPTNEKRRDF